MTPQDRMDHEDESVTHRFEVEVPGTPEEVWQALATGPGITAWFVPAQVEERGGGATRLEVMPGQEQTGVVSAWEPPHRFAYDERWQPPEGPSIGFATEFLVEATAGGTCVVRLVASAFGSGEDWQEELGGALEGWPTMLDNLCLYLTHFRGQTCATVRAFGTSDLAQSEAAYGLRADLGLLEAAVGDRVSVSSGAVRFSGTLERVTDEEVKLILDAPAPGVASAIAGAFGGTVLISLAAWLYGDEAAAVADREEPGWRAWLAERFPPAAMPGAG